MFVITLKTLSTVIGTATILATSAISVKANPLYVSTYVSTSNGKVGSVDEATGAYTPLLNSIGFTDIALNSAGDLWGITFSNLYSIDLTTNTTNLVGGLGVGMNGLGFSSDDNLYGTGGNRFYSIDINTGAASQIASVLGFSSSGDIEYDATRGLFWATSSGDPFKWTISKDGILKSSGDSLWTISKDGIANKVGNIGYSSVYGLAFGEDNTLFGYTNSSQLGYTTSGQQIQIALDLDTGSGTFVKNITGMDNSAGIVWGSASHSRNVALPTVPTESTPEPSSLLGLATLGVFMLRRKYRLTHQ